MIDLKTLKQLVKLMSEQDLTELDLEDDKGEKVRLRRRGNAPEVQYLTGAPQMPTQTAAAPQPAPQGDAQPAAQASADPGASSGSNEPTGEVIDSPMVGTFYSAPSPDSEDFVSVGSRVEADTVVCIIEAMKVFNEIKAETTGTIKRILVENGQAVEYGQALFEIEPD